MTAFVSGTPTVPASVATRIVEAADFNRTVLLTELVGGTRVAFTEALAPFGAQIGSLRIGSGVAAQFVLPADEELWVHPGGSPATVSVFVTAV